MNIIAYFIYFLSFHAYLFVNHFLILKSIKTDGLKNYDHKPNNNNRYKIKNT